MKNEIITMQNVPEGMKLIDRYLPSDYCDTARMTDTCASG